MVVMSVIVVIAVVVVIAVIAIMAGVHALQLQFGIALLQCYLPVSTDSGDCGLYTAIILAAKLTVMLTLGVNLLACTHWQR